MEEVDDEDNHPKNIPPTKKSRILELSDGSDDEEDDCRAMIVVSNDSDEAENEDENDDIPEELEELAETQLGQLLH